MLEKRNDIAYSFDAQRQARMEMREAIWRMQGSQDLVQVLQCMYRQLRTLDIPFHYNMIEVETSPPKITAYTLNRAGELHEIAIKEDQPTANILRFWQSGDVVYRRDLQREDHFGESAYLKGLARSVVDLPFTYGTMAVSSLEAEAFSVADWTFCATWPASSRKASSACGTCTTSKRKSSAPTCWPPPSP